jgi:hypothetical protein
VRLLPGRRHRRARPDRLSTESFYANAANEVELLGQQPQLVVGQPVPSLDVLPTAVLARIVGLAANTELFVLCGDIWSSASKQNSTENSSPPSPSMEERASSAWPARRQSDVVTVPRVSE